jgi:DNA/RNA-binding protein KIN17
MDSNVTQQGMNSTRAALERFHTLPIKIQSIYSLKAIALNITHFYVLNIFSESHLRQMRLFAENPDQQIDEFSAEFERGFVEMLSYRHGTKRVLANRVYQEYIGDKHHIHMNATIWTSLTEICKYLGKEGKVTADETEKGWFIQYIDRDPRLLAKQAAMDQRKVVEYDQEERTKRAIELQIAACAESERRKKLENGDDENDQQIAVNEDLTREEGDKIEIAFGTKTGLLSKGIKRPLKSISFGFDKSSLSETEGKGDGEGGSENKSSSRDSREEEPQSKRFLPPSSSFSSSNSSSSSTSSSFQPFLPPSTSTSKPTSSSTSTSTSTSMSGQAARTVPMSAMEQIRMEEEKKKNTLKQKQKEAVAENTEYWLQPGIVVKILNKKVGNGKFYQRKAVVLEVIDKYVGELNVLECNTILRIDQEHLETVIPKVRRFTFLVIRFPSLSLPLFLHLFLLFISPLFLLPILPFFLSLSIFVRLFFPLSLHLLPLLPSLSYSITLLITF